MSSETSYMCKYQEHVDSPFHDPFKKETALIQFFFFTIKMFLHSLFFSSREKQPMAMEDAETYHWSFRRSDTQTLRQDTCVVGGAGAMPQQLPVV